MSVISLRIRVHSRNRFLPGFTVGVVGIKNINVTKVCVEMKNYVFYLSNGDKID